MKKIVVIALMSASLFAGVYHLKPIKITKDITCVIGDFSPPNKKNMGFVSNMCYVNMGDSLVVLDAGPTYEFAKEFYGLMKKEYPGKKVSAVILSNFHDDRILGSSFFQENGAKIIAYKNINDDIKTYKSKFDRIKNVVPAKIYQNTKLILAGDLVNDGYKIKGSKKTLEIIKPSKISEEKSDIAIYSPEDSFLFVGNMVFTDRMLNYRKESNIDGWIKALEKLSKLKAKYIFGGHGADYSSNSYKTTLRYLKIVKRDVEKAAKNDLDEIDLVKSVHTKEFKDLKHFKSLNYRAIHNYNDQLQWK